MVLAQQGDKDMKRFMLAMNDLASARRAAEYLAPLTLALPECDIFLLTLLTDCPYNDVELEACLEQSGQAPEVHGSDDHLAQIAAVQLLHREMTELLVSAGLDDNRIISKIHPLQTSPAEDLLSYAEQNACDTLVVARSNAGGLHRLVLGSVSSELIKKAKHRAIWVIS
jgi:nucleotide-binding universal stress UspA family protein